MQAPKNRLIAFPSSEQIALTPALWLACGVISYNFALLAQHAMRILAPKEIPHLTDSRRETIDRGFAVAIDARGLMPSIRAAILQISRTLLTPLHFAVTLQGRDGSSYLLVEFHGALDLPLNDHAENTPPPSPTPSGRETAAIHPPEAANA